MVSEIPKEKWFDNQKYFYKSIRLEKHEAQNIAKDTRDKGFNARIVPSRDRVTGHTQYVVYTSKHQSKTRKDKDFLVAIGLLKPKNKIAVRKGLVGTPGDVKRIADRRNKASEKRLAEREASDRRRRAIK